MAEFFVMVKTPKDKQRFRVISVVVQCQEKIHQALSRHWKDESFSIDSEIVEGNMLAGVVHSLPEAPIGGWNEQVEEFLMEYLQQTKDFIHQLITRTQRPSVCIVLSSCAVYGNQDSIIEEGHPVVSNVWSAWIMEYESLFTSLEQVGIRVVHIRSGVMLEAKSVPSAYIYAGKKDDWVSWVSINDLCRFVDQILRRVDMKGMFHLAHPNWVQKSACIQKKRMRALSLMRNFVQGNSIFSPSQRVVSQRLNELDFCFSVDKIVKI